MRKSYGSWDPELAKPFIGHWEGRELTAYPCSAGVWTIGSGHTEGVKEGDTCTEEQADRWLIEDITSRQRALAHYVNKPVTEGQFVALTSLAFNVGVQNVLKSKLLRKLNAGDFDGAAEEFLDFDLANGKKVPGLTRRRKAEYALFLGGTEE